MTSFADVAALAGNPLSYAEGRKFAAILGATPSKGARSPLLWNAAFAAHGVDAEMIPLDVTSEKLPALLEALDANPQFIGGAIAVPHKETTAAWLGDRLTAEAKDIGAVNCLFRGADGRIMGTNTDGEGALRSYEARFGKLAGKRVVLLGLGGAGKAVAAYFRRAVDPAGVLVVSSQSAAKEAFASRISATWVPWSAAPATLGDADVLVNCTSVGFGDQADASPVTAEQLQVLPSGARVFDIVYQPSPSKLLSLAQSRGLEILDGTPMNREQAVLAYGYAAPQPQGADVTRSAMANAGK